MLKLKLSMQIMLPALSRIGFLNLTILIKYRSYILPYILVTEYTARRVNTPTYDRIFGTVEKKGISKSCSTRVVCLGNRQSSKQTSFSSWHSRSTVAVKYFSEEQLAISACNL